MRILELKIINWKKHNPRADVKTCTWFKMSNSFFEDPEFFMVSGDGQRLWIYLLGLASKKPTDGTIKINTQMAANALRISIDSIDFALLELVKTGSLSQSAVTLVSNVLPSERKEEVVIPLEERREEEKRGEERREDAAKKFLPSDSSQENLKTDISIQVITILNSLGSTKHPIDDGTRSLIRSRQEDGYSLQDFADVIKFKVAEWDNDPKTKQWLRPKTLFGHKFHTYLAQSKNPFKSKNRPNGGNPYYAELERRRNSGETAS